MKNYLQNIKEAIKDRKQEFLTGFTLIETLVAIAVLCTIMIGPLSLATSSIKAASLSQNQITASFLAQEAVEYILNLRRNNIIQNKNWLNGMNQCFGSNGCYVDVINNGFGPCGATCQKIKYDQNNFYNYSTGEDTIFTRTVKIDKINLGGAEDEAKIEVLVQWVERLGGQRSFTLQEEIFDW
jgi:prepilin-type N-terminal cleavage/methylation domain-containing protein